MQGNDGLEKPTFAEFEENGRRKETKNMDNQRNLKIVLGRLIDNNLK